MRPMPATIGQVPLREMPRRRAAKVRLLRTERGQMQVPDTREDIGDPAITAEATMGAVIMAAVIDGGGLCHRRRG